MACAQDLRILQRLLKRSKWMYRMSSSGTTSQAGSTNDKHKSSEKVTTRNPLPVFYDLRVQTLLKKMTGFDVAKVFDGSLVEDYSKPKFIVVTDDELKLLQERAIKKASFLLHMPPAMKGEQADDQIYSNDPEISPFLDHKIVFSDLSLGVKDRNRFVAVRETNGVLRPGTPEEKRRVNQMFNPKRCRDIFMPRMFEKEHLENILHPDNYRYILERACCQFEPDNPDFIRVCHRIYDHAAERESFDTLRSTRFFGPMAFYFVWYNNVELLLIDMIQRNLLNDAIDLLQLYNFIHPEAGLHIDFTAEYTVEEQLKILRDFCKGHAKLKYKGRLELTVQHFEDSLDSEQEQKQAESA